MKDLEKLFTASELNTIKRFVAFVAESNQENASQFSINETDDEVKAEVKEWLRQRYLRGHGQRKN